MTLNARWFHFALIGLALSQPSLAQSPSKNLYVLPGFATEEKNKAQSTYVDQLQLVKVDPSQFEFESGYVYLRKKINSSRYLLYKGRPNPERFSKLYAFAPGTLRPQQILNYKIYRKTNKKAFEDELDLYFDASGIYNDASPSLFIKKDDQWVELVKNKQNARVLGFETHPDRAEIRTQNGLLLGNTPLSTSLSGNGVQYFYLDKEGYLPLVYGLDLESLNNPNTKIDLLTRTQSSESLAPFNLIPASADSNHRYLDSSEIYLRNQLDLNYAKVSALDSQFQKDYYTPLTQDPNWSEDKRSQYQNYFKQFERTRRSAFEAYAKNWLNRIADQEANLQLLQNAKNQKHQRTLNLELQAQLTSLTKSTQGYKVQMNVSGAQNWVQATWDGSVFIDSTKIKTLDSLSKKGTKFNLTVKTEDWPVSFVGLDGQRIYRYYRLGAPEVKIGNTPLRLAGAWSFSPAMMSLPDVARFVRADSMNAIDQLNQKLEQELERQKQELKNRTAEIQKLDLLVRGKVIEVSGGTFVYKGKNVTVSPFAMNATEITQEHYQRVTGKNPATDFKQAQFPIMNVSWEKARDFCKEIGGFLPTEAQWEYAAKAGTNTYYYWGERQMQGQGLSPIPWAVFDENSINLGKPGPDLVANHRPNAWGFYDMAGNVQEWVHDAHAWWYGSTIMSSKDPKGPSTLIADDHRIKGGGWRSAKRELEHAKYDHEDPRYWADDLGMRCAFPALSTPSLDSLQLKLEQFQQRQKK